MPTHYIEQLIRLVGQSELASDIADFLPGRVESNSPQRTGTGYADLTIDEMLGC